MPTWAPGDPWPSATPGGASSPRWGGYVRLWVRAAIAAGQAFHLGEHANDRLNAGNVLGGGIPALSRPRIGVSALWVDLSCDVLDVEIAGGASTSQGILSRADAATCVLTLADPTGKYDPLNNDSPFSYGGRSRLVPGTPLEVFAEVVDPADSSVMQQHLFVGTVDTWSEGWTTRGSTRQAQVVASDDTKTWARFDRPEQPAVGAGDTTRQRVERLVTFYGWEGTTDQPTVSTVTLQATTLAQSGWELLNRAIDDELGYVHFTPWGFLRWVNRATWYEHPEPTLVLGCIADEPAAHDVLIEAAPITVDLQMRNAIYAARTGGTTQTAESLSSQERYGRYDYKRTDLGLNDDVQAAQWASDLLTIYAYPQTGLEDVTMLPALDPASWDLWPVLFNLDLVSDLVRVVWSPPDLELEPIDVSSRVVGYRHRITRAEWSLRWQLVNADPFGGAGVVFTMGPDAQDRLDAGFVLGLT